MNRDMDMAMDRKYYRVKHKIDFYLKINNEEDCSKYLFNIEHGDFLIDGTRSYTLNIIRWNYPDIIKPDIDMLKIVKTNSAFIDHRNKNLLLHKEKFILKLCFEAGRYESEMVIYDKYKGLPYLWFIKNSYNSDSSETVVKVFKVVDSVIHLNYNLNLPKKSYFYIKCSLLPLKDIMINNNNTFIFASSSPYESTLTDNVTDPGTKVKVKASSNAVASKADTEENKPNKLYEHPDPVIAKKGDPWSKDAARFKNNNKPKVKVTKEDLDKIIN